VWAAARRAIVSFFGQQCQRRTRRRVGSALTGCGAPRGCFVCVVFVAVALAAGRLVSPQAPPTPLPDLTPIVLDAVATVADADDAGDEITPVRPVGGGTPLVSVAAAAAAVNAADAAAAAAAAAAAGVRAKRRRRADAAAAAAAAGSQRGRGGTGGDGGGGGGGPSLPAAGTRLVMQGGRRSEEDDADALARGDSDDPATLPSTFVVPDFDVAATAPVGASASSSDTDSLTVGPVPRGHRRRGRGGHPRKRRRTRPPADTGVVSDDSDAGLLRDAVLAGEYGAAGGDGGDSDGPRFQTQPLMFAGATAQSALPVVHDGQVWTLLVEALAMGALHPGWTRSRHMAQRRHVAAALSNVTDRLTSSLRATASDAWPPAVTRALRSRPRVAVGPPPVAPVGFVACDACRQWKQARSVVRVAGRRYAADVFWPTPIAFSVGRAVRLPGAPGEPPAWAIHVSLSADEVRRAAASPAGDEISDSDGDGGRPATGPTRTRRRRQRQQRRRQRRRRGGSSDDSLASAPSSASGASASDSDGGSTSGSTSSTSAASTEGDQAEFVAPHPALRRTLRRWRAARAASPHTDALWAGRTCAHRCLLYHRLSHYARWAAGVVRRRAVALLAAGRVRVALPAAVDDRDRVIHAVTVRLVGAAPLAARLRAYLDDAVEEARLYRVARKADFFANPSPRLRLLRQHAAAFGGRLDASGSDSE